MELLDRFTGCLLGLAVGDALGAPAEFMSREAVQRSFGRLREMEGGGWLELKPGQVTDDTQMMLCIAESLVARGTLDPDDVARRFLSWFRRGPRDIGLTTKTTLAKIAEGVPWQQAAQEAHRELKGRTAGNGGLMRCAPLALRYYQEPDRLLRETVVSCRITHWHDEAAYSAVALNMVISGCLVGESIRQALESAVTGIESLNPQVAGALDAALTGPYEKPEVSGRATDTLQAASRCFYQSRSFEHAVEEAVNLGGDTDTVGAVCGAVAGAYYGVGAIPSRWLEVVESREHIDSLARALYHIAETNAKQRAERVHGREALL